MKKVTKKVQPKTEEQVPEQKKLLNMNEVFKKLKADEIKNPRAKKIAVKLDGLNAKANESIQQMNQIQSRLKEIEADVNSIMGQMQNAVEFLTDEVEESGW